MTNPYETRPGRNPWCLIAWCVLVGVLCFAFNHANAQPISMETTHAT